MENTFHFIKYNNYYKTVFIEEKTFNWNRSKPNVQENEKRYTKTTLLTCKTIHFSSSTSDLVSCYMFFE